MTQTRTPAENLSDMDLADLDLQHATPYDQPWLTSLLRPVLIAVLVVCLDEVVMAFIARVAPSLAGGYVPVILTLSVIAVIIGCVTTTFLAQPRYRQRRTSGYRLAEVGLLLALTRLAIWIVTGEAPEISEFFIHPLDTLFDGLFIVGGLIVTFSWIIATDTTDDLLRLALQPDELYAIQMDRIGEMVRSANSDRPSILRGIVTRWIGGGLLMVLLAASLQIAPSSNGLFAIARQNIQLSVIGAIVLYFLIGLLLVSQGQLALLRSRWTIDRVPSTVSVLRNWPLYVFGLLLFMGLLAAMMPFGGTFYLAQVLAAMVRFVFDTLFGILQFFMMLLLLLISLITGKAPPPVQEKAPPAPQPILPPPPEQTSHLPLWAGGALFWVTMALLLGYAAYIYFGGRGFNFAWLRAFWQALRERWLQWFGAYQQWQMNRIRDAISKASRAKDQDQDHLSAWRQLDKLNPSQRVRYLYLSLLEYAAQQGIQRADAETPLQYAPRLAQQVAQAQQSQLAATVTPTQTSETVSEPPKPLLQPTENQVQSALADVKALTDAFIQARYASQPVEAAKVPFLEKIWTQIKQQLHL
ncbi:MAG: hypothetical protein U0350_51745 [Caldilineaceae bacterium]